MKWVVIYAWLMLVSCTKQCDNQMEKQWMVVALYDDTHQSFVRKKIQKMLIMAPLEVKYSL